MTKSSMRCISISTRMGLAHPTLALTRPSARNVYRRQQSGCKAMGNLVFWASLPVVLTQSVRALSLECWATCKRTVTSGSEHPGGPQGHGGGLIFFRWSRPQRLRILTILISCLPTFLPVREVRAALQPLRQPPQQLRPPLKPQPLQPAPAQGLLLLQQHPTGRSVAALAGQGRRHVPARIPAKRRMRTTRNVCKPELWEIQHESFFGYQ